MPARTRQERSSLAEFSRDRTRGGLPFETLFVTVSDVYRARHSCDATLRSCKLTAPISVAFPISKMTSQCAVHDDQRLERLSHPANLLYIDERDRKGGARFACAIR